MYVSLTNSKLAGSWEHSAGTPDPTMRSSAISFLRCKKEGQLTLEPMVVGKYRGC
jgi:hypothetical protein